MYKTVVVTFFVTGSMLFLILTLDHRRVYDTARGVLCGSDIVDQNVATVRATEKPKRSFAPASSAVYSFPTDVQMYGYSNGSGLDDKYVRMSLSVKTSRNDSSGPLLIRLASGKRFEKFVNWCIWYSQLLPSGRVVARRSYVSDGGPMVEDEIVSDHAINDGKYHRVTFAVRPKQFRLRIDDNETEDEYVDSSRAPDYSSFTVWIGGGPEDYRGNNLRGGSIGDVVLGKEEEKTFEMRKRYSDD